MTLLDFIRREIVLVCPNIKYDDSDIKCIKSHSGMNKLWILNLPMSMFSAVLQDGTFQSFQKSERDLETNFVSDATKIIVCADSREELGY